MLRLAFHSVYALLPYHNNIIVCLMPYAVSSAPEPELSCQTKKGTVYYKQGRTGEGNPLLYYVPEELKSKYRR